MNGQQITAADGLAIWLANNHPALFQALAARSLERAGFADWSDILKSIGTGITTAVKSVGSYLASSDGVKTLSSLAGSYLTTKAQKDVLNMQVQRAEQGQEPASISYVMDSYTGQATPVYTANGVTAQLDLNILRGLTPKPWYQTYALPLAIGGSVLFLMVIYRMRAR
jgi:hypothetical protein